MERTISAERLYSITKDNSYQNIRFGNTLSGIPESLANNNKVIELLFFQQALSCDIAYLRYKEMRDFVAKEKVEDVLGHLKEQREQTMAELYEEIQKAGNKYPELKEVGLKQVEKETE